MVMCRAPGGVYIAGGIVPRLMDRVNKGYLLDAFINKAGRPRFSGILEGIPLYIVTNTNVGIIGSREVAIRLVKEQQGAQGPELVKAIS